MVGLHRAVVDHGPALHRLDNEAGVTVAGFGHRGHANDDRRGPRPNPLPQPEIVVDELLGTPVGVDRRPTRGPALLITYSSAIDKRIGNSNRPQASRLQFCPVHDIDSLPLDENRQRQLRAGQRDPSEAVYVKLDEDQEGVALLSEAYTIPTSFFALESREFTGHPDADPRDPFHMCANENDDSRVLSMEQAELEVMLKKMAFYWTRTDRQVPG
jgi:hypothetical protein